MDKDYYKIMGVSKDASEADIKTAYRRLARKYHPDISKEPNAEEKFKEMGEAYEVLKDPAKRKEYDQFQNQQSFNQRNYQQYSDNAHAQGGNPYENMHFDSDIFESIFGHARQQRSQPSAGQNYQGQINITLEEAFKGTERSVQVPVDKDGETKLQTLNVKIPAGIKSGQQIRLAGQGGPGFNGGPRGDLLITIDIMKHTLFDVIDNDIYLTLPITPWEAALGASITVPTLAGKIDLKIPAGSQGGQKLRIKERGLGAKPGYQYVTLKIATPPATTEAATDLYQKMAEVMPFNPREKLGV